MCRFYRWNLTGDNKLGLKILLSAFNLCVVRETNSKYIYFGQKFKLLFKELVN